MKKYLIIAISILLYCLPSFSQAPQGLNYQAVAYNAGGTPVLNQAIGVRFSILDGSATGPSVYEETQAPTTDNTGLFSIVIGNGTVVSGTFSAINWGNGTKWLKTEIDIAGGTNYLVMGTSQFMSVPYALYANKSGFSYGSFTIPDGFNNITSIVIPDSVNYTVPAGKNLYLPTAMNGIVIDGDTLSTNLAGNGADAKTFVGASAGSVVWMPNYSISAFLTDKTVDWITVDAATAPYTIPPNKKFVIVNSTIFTHNNYVPQVANCRITVNGTPVRSTFANTVFTAGTTISSTGCTAAMNPTFVLNGYLID